MDQTDSRSTNDSTDGWIAYQAYSSATEIEIADIRSIEGERYLGNEHPIQGLMKTAMESIKDMVDVNTIVGDAVHTTDGKVVIPLSRVAFGFAAGGSEFSVERTRDRHHNEEMTSSDFPFGGGSGAGVSVQPVGFLIVGEGQIRMLPVSGAASTDRLMDLAPTLMEFVQKFFDRDREPEGEDRATHSNPVRVTARKKITEETESL